MQLQDVSYALNAVAQVAQTGGRIVESIDRGRSRGRLGLILFGVGVGVGLGALLFSETARTRARTWLVGAPAGPPSRVDAPAETPIPPIAKARVEDVARPH
jgi:hypothetical protein